ncbi:MULTISPECIES: acyltransferase [unclassified Herbaspirillum]|nr:MULTISPECIES: acyltransferase [unclassified Herbaspirillum]MAF01608.1 acyltransferase [Herbaspirillum sp.]MBO15846.1 acyltransferase [Herbaspirillum sp.]|tara:strand:- start:1790 stop:2872 length:1083 start_codon:yes stop_codon:yes gene_type:complete
MNKKDHFLTLDGFRGIAAILVVLRHTTPFFGNNPFFSSYLAVDLFFLLSGVVLCRSYESRLLNGMRLGAFLRIRLLRLYPLYFLGICIGLIAASDWAASHKAFVSATAICSFLLLPSLFNKVLFPLNEPAWSLSAELIVNLLYAWKIRCLSNRVLLSIMAVCMLCLAAFAVISPAHGFDAGFMRNTYYVSFLRVGFSFAAGVVLYRWYATRAGGIMFSNRNAFLSLVGVALLLCATFPRGMLPVYDALAVAIGFPALVYVGMRFQPTGLLALLCEFLGVVSYPVYIIHSPLAENIRHLFPSVTGRGVESYAPLGGVIILVFLILLAWLLHHFYDEPVRNALGRWLTKISSKKTKINASQV